jgi:DNA-directed RNA polymerase subunit beta
MQTFVFCLSFATLCASRQSFLQRVGGLWLAFVFWCKPRKPEQCSRPCNANAKGVEKFFFFFMVHANYFLPDFLEIQRQGFFYLLEKGILEEIQKRNPITNFEKQIEIFFYPEYYRFTKPLYSIEQALFFKKSYVAKFYVPVQLTDRKKKRIFLKWVLLAHFPLMTNRGHFVLNGSPRVIIHQLVRSPGIYFRENKHEIFSSKWSEKPTTTFRRFYADIISAKGTWLRIESEKDFSLWAKMKKGPKIPLLWFLLGMGLSEKFILNSVSKPTNLFESFTKEMEKLKKSNSQKEPKYPYVSSPKQAWEQIQKLLKLKKTSKKSLVSVSLSEKKNALSTEIKKKESFHQEKVQAIDFSNDNVLAEKKEQRIQKIESFDFGRKWFFNKFMNPRMYDLGKQGRLSMNKKLGLTISPEQTTLTALDLLLATDYLMKMQDGVYEVDDIDHLKNKRVRSSGECLQEIFSIGFLRLERSIRLKLNSSTSGQRFQSQPQQSSTFHLQSFLNTRPINGAFREFFGTHPLSQFMDQINPLAEMTHKRRLTSLGPGGVSRDTATLAIRGIHPSHYGRICPIETPEGKNTGLVNSLTTYAKLSSSGLLKSPFYKVLKGQIQKNSGVFFLDPEQEEHFKIATPDLQLTRLGFLPKSSIPVRFGKRFVRMKPRRLALMGVSPLQMISVATSFIPFLEHDDANRALMGSNMQRQAVPIIRPERPFLGTGLEARVISDSGHAVFAKKSGYVFYSSGSSICLYVF